MAFSRFKPRWALAFLCPHLKAQTMYLCSSWVIFVLGKYFHLLFTSFLCLDLVRSILLIYAGLLSSLLEHSSRWMNLGLGESDPLKLTSFSGSLFYSVSLFSRSLLPALPCTLLPVQSTTFSINCGPFTTSLHS